MPKLAFAGLLNLDRIYSLPHQPGPDEKVRAESLLVRPGGPATGAAMTAARLGCEAWLCARTGRDATGMQLRQLLRHEGVDDGAVISDDLPSAESAVFSKPDASRCLASFRPHSEALPDVYAALPADCATLLFDGHLAPMAARRLIAEARRQKTEIVLDGGTCRPESLALFELCDWAVVSSNFAREFAGVSDAAAALPKLAEKHRRVVITLGSAGLVASIDGELFSLPARPLGGSFTNGAGDCFHGAFCVARSLGLEPLPALIFARDTASLFVRDGRAPSRAEVAALG